ncbi:Putative recombination initiation defects 3, partial [Linum perenne]
LSVDRHYNKLAFSGVRLLSPFSFHHDSNPLASQMKLKINKACDLSSISVLPPHSRRLSSVQPGTQPSSSQLRSQPTEQSFSQGFSSQHGFFSQFSQTFLDDAFLSDQRLNSQGRESSVKKASSVPPPGFTREESQVPNSRPSVSLMRKWNRGSAGDGKCQISDELEHRIGTIETSMNKFGMVMDSVQRDIMQVNKGTKEVLLEGELSSAMNGFCKQLVDQNFCSMDGIRQKLLALDTSLLTMNKGLGYVKSTFDESLKSMTEQQNKGVSQDKMQEMFFQLSSLPGQMEASLLKLHDMLHATYTQEMQVNILFFLGRSVVLMSTLFNC